MAELDEVFGSQAAADQIVRSDERVVALVAEAVDKHVRDALVPQPAHGRILEKAAGHDDAIDPPGVQALQVRALAGRAAVGIAEQDVVATRRGGVFHAAEEGGEERIGDVRDDDRQHQRLSELQPAGDPVGPVFGFAQQRLDPLPGRRSDAQVRVVVGHSGDGGGVDLGASGQLLERYRHLHVLIDKPFTRA